MKLDKTDRLTNGLACKDGGATGARTPDLNTASVALSQLSYGPTLPNAGIIPRHLSILQPLNLARGKIVALYWDTLVPTLWGGAGLQIRPNKRTARLDCKSAPTREMFGWI